MADNNEAVLFWLEQEPVDGVDFVYLPADTPMSRPSPKVSYQMHKIKELRKQRAVERLKAYHFEQCADRRQQLAQCVVREELPNQHQEVYEKVDSASHLKEVIPDILQLLDDIQRLKEGSLTVDAFRQPEPTEEDLQAKQKRAIREKVKQSYSDCIDEKVNEQQHNLKQLYNHRLSLIAPQLLQQHHQHHHQQQQPQQQQPQQQQPQQHHHHQQQQPIDVAPTPPLPPRVSQRDPRERIAEEYPSRTQS
ncbi:uncharacterized protein EV154DRAFT_601993 [Mucor mucedo]|uniref:uncharacterized protein n=1 Tax=Mucor mucedo TaxID=29922 RepID=UPI002220784C|nr:uncharacterized protein EV154DRAFT_601993 [Mucor mucedo]KAI7892050.1 hypothetical protein EV154DRAFT_601993 [Mucor mucedo]